MKGIKTKEKKAKKDKKKNQNNSEGAENKAAKPKVEELMVSLFHTVIYKCKKFLCKFIKI